MEKLSVARTSVILIVEDEPILRMAAVDLVEEAGFEAIEAAHADEAIKILENRTDVRIVFTDIQMPGSMDGVKLAAFVRHRWPPIELIITSARYMPELVLPERGIFLLKPYNPATLVEIFRRFAA